MQKLLNSAVVALSGLASIGAHAQEPQAYRFEFTWSGGGSYCYYRDLCREVTFGATLPITTHGETGTFSQTLGGYDFTIVTKPDSSDPAFADAVISGTIHAGSVDGGIIRNTFSFLADSSDPSVGGIREDSGSLETFFGDARISRGAAIPEPAESALILAGLAVMGMLLRRRTGQGR